MQTKLEQLKAKAEKAKVDHQVAISKRDELLSVMKERYDVSSVDEALEKAKNLVSEIDNLEEKRDRLISKAEGMLEEYEQSEG